MFRRKLHDHETKALREALACMNTLVNTGIDVDAKALETIKAMLGIRETISDTMSNAIDECVEREREVA